MAKKARPEPSKKAAPKREPRDAAKRKAEWHKLIKKASRRLSRERVPRNPTEAHAWLMQFTGELLDVLEKMHEELRPVAKAARHTPVPQWSGSSRGS